MNKEHVPRKTINSQNGILQNKKKEVLVCMRDNTFGSGGLMVEILHPSAVFAIGKNTVTSHPARVEVPDCCLC